MEFALAALKINPSLQQLNFDGTGINAPFKSKKNAIAFAKLVVGHPCLDVLVITNCGIGQNTLFPALMPLMCHVASICFDGNGIGSYGATLIADCLATNPCVKKLSLAHNVMVDGDAAKLAASLRTNSTLRSLELIGNDFTRVGIASLANAIYGSGLNEIHDSNHVCSIDLFPDQNLNEFEVQKDNILNKLVGIVLKVQYLHAVVPQKLVPRFIDLLQKGGSFYHSKFDPFSTVFRCIRMHISTQHLHLVSVEEFVKRFKSSLHLSAET